MTTSQHRIHPANRIRRAGILAAATIALGGSAFTGIPSAFGEPRELDMGVYEKCMKAKAHWKPQSHAIAICCIDAGGDPIFAPGTTTQTGCAAPVPEAEPFNPQQSGPIVVPGEVADPVTPAAPGPIVRPTGPLAPAAG